MGNLISHPDPIIRHVDTSLTEIVNFLYSAIVDDVVADGTRSELYKLLDGMFARNHPDGEKVLLERLLSVRLNGPGAIRFSKERPVMSQVRVKEEAGGSQLVLHCTMKFRVESLAFRLTWARHMFNIPSIAPAELTLKDLLFDGTMHLTIDRSAFPEISVRTKFENVTLHTDVGSVGANHGDAEVSKLLSLFSTFYTRSLAKELQAEEKTHQFSVAGLGVQSAAEKALRAKFQQDLAELKAKEAQEEAARDAEREAQLAATIKAADDAARAKLAAIGEASTKVVEMKVSASASGPEETKSSDAAPLAEGGVGNPAASPPALHY